jgi:hypothetical protein
MKRTRIIAPEDLLDRLQAIAHRERTSLAEVIRHAGVWNREELLAPLVFVPTKRQSDTDSNHLRFPACRWERSEPSSFWVRLLWRRLGSELAGTVWRQPSRRRASFCSPGSGWAASHWASSSRSPIAPSSCFTWFWGLASPETVGARASTD